MNIKAIKCGECKDIIYSRTRHDFHACSCGKTFIDGGFEYFRVGSETMNYEIVDIEVEATRSELYEDWNKRFDKFGLIKADN